MCELLTTILILTRKKYLLIEIKPPLPLYLAIIKKKKSLAILCLLFYIVK